MMKKRLFSILGILLAIFSFTNVFALSKSDMTTLKLKNIKKLTNPSGFSSVQGGTTTDKYIVSLFRNSTDTKTAVVVLNKNNYKKTKLGGTNYKLGHGNSATYNNKTNEVLTMDKNIVHVLNATTFKEKKKIKLDKTYHAIGYDSKTNQYVLASSSGNKTIFHIMDENFKEKSKFSIVVNMTRQSLTVKNGVIYYCTYESGRKTKYQKQYDGVLKSKENAIYVYDLNGNKKTIYYIPKTYNNESFNEIENVSFDRDKIIVQFNQHGKAGYYTSISKLKNYTLTGNSKNNNSNTNNNTKETATIDDIIYPMYLPVNTYLTNQERVSTSDGERMILTFTGDKAFTLVEETASYSQNPEIIPTYGSVELIGASLAVINDNSASWFNNGIEYYIVSDVMSTGELLQVVRSISVLPVSK